jgi:glycosyltransferase involved in cell wall biosynthesis
MNVLFIINDLRRGGAERFLVDHCTELSKYKNIKIRICVLNDFNQFEEETKDFDLSNLEYEFYSFKKKNINKTLIDTIDNFQPEIIHSNLFLSEFITSYYLKDEIKYVCHGHDNMFQFQKFKLYFFFNKSKLTNLIEKYILFWKKYRKHKTYFIANSSHTFNYYKSVLPSYLKTEVVQLDYGFDYQKFYNPIKKQINPSEKIKIINVGSFQHKKNQKFIIEIAKQLLKKTSNFEINLIGQGDLYEEVKDSIASNQLESYVILRGVQNNVEDWYKASHIYLHSAYYEPFGLVFLEAMASGLPIITLDGKGNRDIICQGKNGFLFEQENPAQFAEALYQLIENPNLYAEMSSFGQSFAKSYDLPIKTKKFISFYQKIING